MCYHKPLAVKERDLLEHYLASFQSITNELEILKERFTKMKNWIRLSVANASNEIQ